MSALFGQVQEDDLPGHESTLEPKPEWRPRYPGSGRLAGKVAIVTGGGGAVRARGRGRRDRLSVRA